MRIVLLLVAGFVLTTPLVAQGLSVIQETSASAQVQTVQAVLSANSYYPGAYQLSVDGNWTLGLDWNHVVDVRGGLSGRSVQTSPLVLDAVYPGYLGWGWLASVEWFPLVLGGPESPWSAGVSIGGRWEFLSYPGLFRDFYLPTVSTGLVFENFPDPSSGFSYRLAIPVNVDLRPGFLLSWRAGVELAVVFRSTGAGAQ